MPYNENLNVLSHDVLRGEFLSEEETDRFRGGFGVSPAVYRYCWNNIRFHKSTKPKHVLWGLNFLKTYGTEHNRLTTAKVKSRKTLRKHVKCVVKKLAKHMPKVVSSSAKSVHIFRCHITDQLFLQQIRWENRKKKKRMIVEGVVFKEKSSQCTVDCLDCRIKEPKPSKKQIRVQHKKGQRKGNPYDSRYKSYKFGKAGLRYEVCICIRTGDIVWVNGGYPAGRMNDVKIYNKKLKYMLEPGELLEADNGYGGQQQIRKKENFVSRVDRRAKARALARHEHVNGLLKNFGVLAQMFRHDIKFHSTCFAACATLTQMSFDNGEKPWQCRY
jgi:hypothetical protein